MVRRNNEFGRHPSEILQDIFSAKPYQIQEPEKAKIIFLGLDANLNKNIEEDKVFFNEFIEYLHDGVKYWEMNGIHTPMLKPSYNEAGKKYHQKFCRLGFTEDNAKDICFMELLNCCTYGSTSKNLKLFKKLLREESNLEHLNRIKKLVKMEKIICISKGVKTYIDKLKLLDTNDSRIIVHTHFSNAITNKELIDLGEKLRNW